MSSSRSSLLHLFLLAACLLADGPMMALVNITIAMGTLPPAKLVMKIFFYEVPTNHAIHIQKSTMKRVDIVQPITFIRILNPSVETLVTKVMFETVDV